MKYFPGISGNEYLNDVIMAFQLILGINNFRIEKRLPTRITPFDINIAEKIPFRPKSKINIKDLELCKYSFDPQDYREDEYIKKLKETSKVEWIKLGELCDIKIYIDNKKLPLVYYYLYLSSMLLHLMYLLPNYVVF